MIEIPSKWDIIPIHASDISAYMRCRRYWDWSSPTRNNLRKKVHVYGVNMNLWFGSGIHYALEHYYNPVLQEDPVASFIRWYTYQWEGGEIAPEWMEHSYDVNPIELPNGNLKIQGLRDIHPQPDHDEFEAFRLLGIGMLSWYRDYYAPKYDDFKVIAAESQFSVPLGFESKDVREDSPNYGKMLEVHARGKRDLIKQDIETERFGIMDHKTKSEITSNYLESLVKDGQVDTYIWASQEEARIYGLPWTVIDHCTHQALRKVVPKPPTVLKDGISPSIARSTESTTAEMFKQYIVDSGLQDWYDDNPKAQGYYEWLVDKGDENFIVRTYITRNKHEIQNQGIHIREVAKEMLSSPAIYPHPTGDYLCIKCQFRPPCIAADDGSDASYMLNDGYETNLDR